MDRALHVITELVNVIYEYDVLDSPPPARFLPNVIDKIDKINEFSVFKCV